MKRHTMERRVDERDDVQKDLDGPAPRIKHCDDAADNQSHAEPSGQAATTQQNEVTFTEEAWIDNHDLHSHFFIDLLNSDLEGHDAFLNDWGTTTLKEPEVADETATHEVFDPPGASALGSSEEALFEVQLSSIQEQGNGTGNPTAEAKGKARDERPTEENPRVQVRSKEEPWDYFSTRPELKASTYPFTAYGYPFDRKLGDGPTTSFGTYDLGGSPSELSPTHRQREESSRFRTDLWEAPVSFGRHSGELEVPISKYSRKRGASDDWGPDVKVKQARRSTDLGPRYHDEDTHIPRSQTVSSLNKLYPDPDDLDYPEPVTSEGSSQQPEGPVFSKLEKSHAPGPASAYPDPCEHELSPYPGPAYQPQSFPQLSYTAFGQGPDSESWESFHRQNFRATNGRSPENRQPLAQPVQKQDGISSRVPAYSHQERRSEQHRGPPAQSQPGVDMSTEPDPLYPYPDMSRPGHGGPGTWPGDWITVNKDRDKYSGFRSVKEKIPGGHPLEMYCYWFPNHVFCNGLDPFMDAGWGGTKVWDHYHPEAREQCKNSDGQFVGRPWNFLQQAFSRRKAQRDAANTQGNVGNGPTQSGQIERRRRRRQSQSEPSTVQRISQAHVGQAQNSQLQHRPSGLRMGLVLQPDNDQLDSHVTRPFEAHNIVTSLTGRQMVPSEPWFEGPLKTCFHRTWQLHWNRDADFAQFSDAEKRAIVIALMQRRFSEFAATVWKESSPVWQSRQHPMAALHAIYPQLSFREQSTHANGEEQFCRYWMQCYLNWLNEILSSEEVDLRRTARAFSYRPQTFGDLYGSTQEQIHGLPQPREAPYEAPVTASAGPRFIEGVIGPDQM